MTTKICNTCCQRQPIASFYKNNQQKDGRSGKCATCTRKGRKHYDHKYNLSLKAKANARRYYYSAKGQAGKKAYRKLYPLLPGVKERLRVLHRGYEKLPHYKARRRKYDLTLKGRAMKARKDAKFFKTPRGRALKKKVEIKRKHQLTAAACTLTLAEWQAIKTAHRNLCAYCHQSKPLEMDHVIPLSKGGNHTKDNILPACRTCNARKGNRTATNAQSGT